DLYYSLGLLLAEQQKYTEAVEFLKIALEQMPDRIRIHFNLGLIYQHLGENSKAESVLMKGLSVQPEDFDLLFALADFYLKTNQFEKAKPIAEKLKIRYPENSIGQDLLNVIQQ
ncbi:MAG: tetratricopeptide repeat protein, partial [Bacteroidales bacterium]